MIFVLWIHFDGEFMDLKSFWLKNCFSAVFRPFLRLFKAKIGDFGEIVPPKFPVVGLFKFSHVRFFWDSRKLFQKFMSEARTSHLKMAQSLKYAIF